MNHKQVRILAAAAFAALALPAQAQWVTLTNSGSPILTNINPKVNVSPQPSVCTNTGVAPTGDQSPVQQQSATLATGKFASYPPPGFIEKFAASYPLNTGSPSKNVGTLYDRALCQGSGTTCDATNTWVLATRVVLNTTVANPPNLTFEVNDVFRTVPSTATVAVGYYMGTSGTTVNTGLAFKYLESAGRTNNGLNQTILRDNTKVAFRADTNASDPERCEPYSRNSAMSPWLYARMTCSSITSTGAPITFKTRVREGGEEAQPVISITTSGFVCNP